ncbi:uncharacterized protein ACOB8E_011309 isoform 2-T2 [Sarcophilus harrisii]
MRGHCGDLLFASSQDVPSPAPHNLAVTERRELRGCFEREAAFYLRYSNSSEIPLSTSLEGQAGLSLQVLSGNATLPEGFNLEPRARPFSILSENPAEKLPSKIIVPRGTPSFSPQREPGLLERAAQDFPRPPAPGCVLGVAVMDTGLIHQAVYSTAQHCPHHCLVLSTPQLLKLWFVTPKGSPN